VKESPQQQRTAGRSCGIQRRVGDILHISIPVKRYTRWNGNNR